MRKILILIVLYFQTDFLFGQPSIPREHIDSIFQSMHVSDNDWVISLSINSGATFLIYDSLGNMLDLPPEGTFLLLKIGKDLFLQKLWYEYLHNPYEVKVNIGNRLKLNKDINFNYSVDSILLTYREQIYPFIYTDDSVYILQQPANHEPNYGMRFKTVKTEGSEKYFTKTDLTESFFFLPYKNLNYLYNSRTFVYRSFVKLLNLIKVNIKAFPQ